MTVRMDWAKVTKTSTCWLWTGMKNNDGYGRIGSSPCRMAHRVAYEELVGPIPEGMTLDHLVDRCTSRACVNPAHLEPVSRGENSRRGTGQSMVIWRTGVCLKGHPITGDNLVTREGRARCRECERRRAREYQRRRKALR